MAGVSANNSSNTMCIPAIDGTLFQLGCLGPALAIIVILASLERRKHFKLEYCNGHPGLLMPINFLRSFSYSNRFTIAATFGATASTCLVLLLGLTGGLFPTDSPPWAKVFEKLVVVLVYGVLFYPFFACLTTDYKLLGSSLGFFYAAIRFFFQLGIQFQCRSSLHDDVKKMLYIEQLGLLPTYLCLAFIMIRFAVLLFLEVRKKWFTSTSGANERAVETGETCLVREPGIKYVKQLFNPGLKSREVADKTWYMRLMHFFYKPRADFKFSTQFVSTLLVSAIAIFEIFMAFLSVFDFLKKWSMTICGTQNWCKDFVGVVYDSLQAATVLSALISVIIQLHFIKCHRNHVLQLYRGQRTFSQNVFVSPAKLVGRSLRFSGYQIAYIIAGYFVWIIFLFILFVILGFLFKLAKYFPGTWDKIKDLGLAFLPTVTMAGFLLLFQMFLAYCIFRDRDFPNITITVDNRRLFSIMSFFFFFYNILLGVFSCAKRIVFGMVLGVMFLSRIDRTSLMQGFQQWDKGFVAYLGFINVLVAHSHPVMLMFCQLLINRNQDRGFEESAPNAQHSMQPQSSKVTGNATVYPREVRLPRLSQKAVNRWQIAVTLLRNPSLIKHRKQGGITRAISVSLRSIRADISELV